MGDVRPVGTAALAALCGYLSPPAWIWLMVSLHPVWLPTELWLLAFGFAIALAAVVLARRALLASTALLIGAGVGWGSWAWHNISICPVSFRGCPPEDLFLYAALPVWFTTLALLTANRLMRTRGQRLRPSGQEPQR
jgi:hypothetical protein